MPLPKAVREKVKQAQELHDAAYKPPSEGEEPSKAQVPPTEPPADPSKQFKEGENTPPAEPQIAEPPAEPSSGQQALGEGGEDTAWQHKYNVLNGKYKAEVPRLHKQVKDLSHQVAQLQSLLANMEQAPPALATASAPAMPADPQIKDQDVEDYGEDLVDLMKRAAHDVVAPEVQRLAQENEQLKSRLGMVTESMSTSARQTVYDELNDKVGEWAVINTSEEFLSWLNTLDPYTGRMKKELLNEAFANNDAARVVAFFKGYLKENALVSTTSDTPPANGQNAPAVDMASLAAPGIARSGAGQGTQEGQETWRQSEISAFYNDVRKGVYKNDPETKARYERSIMDAMKNNRIVA